MNVDSPLSLNELTRHKPWLSLWLVWMVGGYMVANSISNLREQLGLSQAQFGNLFGVHPMTVSKWERGVLQPNPYQLALIAEFGRSAEAKEVRETLGAVLIGAGIAAALYLLLKNSQN